MVISRANFLLDGKIPDSNVATHFDPLCTVLVYAYIREVCLKGTLEYVKPNTSHHPKSENIQID